MDRRDFMRLAGLAGLALVPGASHHARAGWATSGKPPTSNHVYEGPLWVFVNASGGWDQTMLCDPKGRENEEELDPVNNYFTDEIGSAGNLLYAPVGYNEVFFQKYYQDLLVINGIDMQTNGHDSGSRHCWSGRLVEGFPSLAALVAAQADPGLPMAYLSFGGYDLTAGLVARTRSGNVNALGRIAHPDRIDPNDPGSNFHSSAAQELITQARTGRREHLLVEAGLPAEREAMSQMFTASGGANELKLLQEFLPDTLSDQPIHRQAQVALAAYRAGICASVNINYGGFDTHGNHDDSHSARLYTLMEGVDLLMQEAEALGVADKLIVVMGSDFGRTPTYNDNNGKDHWSVSSMLLMGQGISGNRVVGATTHKVQPLTVNAGSLALDEGGVRIRPEHIHAALRDHAGLGEDLAARFPLNPAESLALLG
ncbi:Tat (twin-arginine translocation) pathway signal sequence domain protein [Plesiocystis pacifica SIR-1]|uniref:Tat (Twin-arginine translocation) pathway signal sequence domain protein n=1 Tax=Plesiocystis pacifica SIR-1 TaxID=391625 RepID=A6GEP9_9BACT|nr:DUF1501 domain-containing protein [Plesiocystis pacifica]EDM75632.1 Tat (twin-arginine translocation) pathway signal sequence domain protein [Plesiocystis pacifica SIR-1]